MHWNPWYGTRWGWVLVVAFVVVMLWALDGTLGG